MSVEYKLITCLPKASPVFSLFSFSSRCLYSACVLFIVSSLALSTFSSIHCFLPSSTLPLLSAPFKHSRFLCCPMPYFGVSTVSPKKSSSFNMFSTSLIAFIKRLNRHHIRNNVRYKCNINNTSVIIFFKWKVKNSQRWYFAWENLPGGFCSFHLYLDFIFDLDFIFLSSFCCCSSFHFCIFILLLFFIYRCSSFTFAFRHHLSPFRGLSPDFYIHFILSAQLIAEWFAILSFSTFPLSSYRELYVFKWACFTHKHFLPYVPSPTF